MKQWGLYICIGMLLASPFNGFTQPTDDQSPSDQSSSLAVEAKVNQFVENNCISCHNSQAETAGLNLESVSKKVTHQNWETWEKAIRKLRARQMPPSFMPKPEEAVYQTILTSLEGTIAVWAEKHPNPGRTNTLRRLNRTEYKNAIRDLLALDIDVTNLLPSDQASHGFDNITVGDLSPMLMERYVKAAQKIARLAVGAPRSTPSGDIIRIPADRTQEGHVEGLPLGTRGGALIPYTFPTPGEYEIKVRLSRDRNEHVEGLKEPHKMIVLLGRKEVASFTVNPPKNSTDHQFVDQHLKARIVVSGGPHKLGVTFLKKDSSLMETKRQPFEAHFNYHRHPRQNPAVYQISITGPYESQEAEKTPSREKIFICDPNECKDEEKCAKRILSNLMRRAYRRPVTEEDLKKPMEFFRQANQEEGFDAGIEMALSAILVSPHFLFRVEKVPEGIAPNTAYQISDLELASRLSFLLWSSIPDENLLDAAIRRVLSQPEALEKQVERMLNDPRSKSLVKNFAGQWLYLRNLESHTPDLRLFPDFDDNLRQAFRKETELFFESIIREDSSVLDLLQADYTYLNERLAKHYGIPHIYGSRFRRVELEEDCKRGGLLRQGSILTVTSYATRTSPVIRGNWVLENMVGTPPPPPPPDVPALEENTVSSNLTVRERLAEHRKNPACASCHNLMDPVGFSLENYDAVGRWRETEEGRPVDASGGTPDGNEFTGVSGLEKALLERGEVFVSTMTEKLLTFALGRGVEYYDGPAVRKIVDNAEKENYKFSSLIKGIVKSKPFQMRRSK